MRLQVRNMPRPQQKAVFAKLMYIDDGKKIKPITVTPYRSKIDINQLKPKLQNKINKALDKHRLLTPEQARFLYNARKELRNATTKEKLILWAEKHKKALKVIESIGISIIAIEGIELLAGVKTLQGLIKPITDVNLSSEGLRKAFANEQTNENIKKLIAKKGANIGLLATGLGTVGTIVKRRRDKVFSESVNQRKQYINYYMKKGYNKNESKQLSNAYLIKLEK